MIKIVQTINIYLHGLLPQRLIGHVAIPIEATDIEELARILSDLKMGANDQGFLLVSLGRYWDKAIITWDEPVRGCTMSDFRLGFGEQYTVEGMPSMQEMFKRLLNRSTASSGYPSPSNLDR